MPSAPLRYCAYSGCGTKVKHGYCDKHYKHQRQPWQGYTRDKRIAGRRLQKLRELLFQQEPWCRICDERLATVRDHIIPLAEGGEDVDDNCQPLCQPCHDKKSAAEALRGRGLAPSTTGRYVVCGAPGSGKTTWVQQRAKPGDVVWDVDKLAAVMLQMPTYPRPPAYAHLYTMLRDTLCHWLAEHPAVSAYLIVADEEQAAKAALAIRGKIIRMPGGGV